mgnify:CR=1 FL=1
MEHSRSREVNWPIVLWLTAAFISLILSVVVFFLVDQLTGLFVATWVPSVLAFGALVTRSSSIQPTADAEVATALASITGGQR